jgi:hypothetical protein
MQFPACEMQLPACEMQLPACEMPFPACEMQLPACEILFPAGEILLPACEISFPAGEILLPVGEISFPAGEKSFGDVRISPSEGVQTFELPYKVEMEFMLFIFTLYFDAKLCIFFNNARNFDCFFCRRSPAAMAGLRP